MTPAIEEPRRESTGATPSYAASILRSGAVQVVVAILVSAGIALAAMAPGIVNYPPTRDSGVFLYGGQRVLEGDIPYRDFWDHKGPLIYYIDALGLYLGNGSLAGVWAVEFVTLVLSGVFGFLLIRREFGGAAAFVSSALWMMALAFVLGRGNLTEEYALPLQFLSLFIFGRALRSPRPRLALFGFGIVAGACFLLRPNYIAIPVAVTVYLVTEGARRRRMREALYRVAVTLAGAVLVVGLAALFLAWHSAIGDAVDAVFRYNLVYISHSLEDRVDAVLDGMFVLAPAGISIFGLLGWGLAVHAVLEPRANRAPLALVEVCALILALELMLTAAAGRSYEHYYMAWLPPLAVLSGYLVHRILTGERSEGAIGMRARAAWILGFAVVGTVLPARRLLPQIARLVGGDVERSTPMVEVIERWMPDDGHLLMWGAETTYNFILGAPSPTRYVYLWPLYTCGYTTAHMAEEFRDRVVATRPLIVDASWTNARVPPLDPARRASWLETAPGCLDLPELREVLDFVDANYEMIEDLEFDFTRWSVYRPIPAGGQSSTGVQTPSATVSCE